MHHLGTTALVRLRARARASCLLQLLSVHCIPGSSAASLCEGCVSARDRSSRRALACPCLPSSSSSPESKAKQNAPGLKASSTRPWLSSWAWRTPHVTRWLAQAARLRCTQAGGTIVVHCAQRQRPPRSPNGMSTSFLQLGCLGGPSRLCILISARSHGNFCSL